MIQEMRARMVDASRDEWKDDWEDVGRLGDDPGDAGKDGG